MANSNGQHARIEDLESKLEDETYLKNEFEVNADGKIVIYVGEAIDLHYTPGGIQGGVRLTKYERHEGTKKERTLVRWFPPKFETKEIPVVEDKLIWQIGKWKRYFNHLPSLFFITCYFDEIKACTKHEHLYYRGSIEAGAANLGIKLSHQLFECVFGPIDDELLKRYRKLKG